MKYENGSVITIQPIILIIFPHPYPATIPHLKRELLLFTFSLQPPISSRYVIGSSG